MYCINCGTEQQEGTRFCRQCGSQFPERVEENSKENNEESNNENCNTKRSKFIMVEMMILCIGIIVSGVLYYYTSTAVVATQKYLEAYADGDYEQMYELLLFDEEDKEYITRESFVTAGIACYQEKNRPVEEVIEIEKISGGLSDATVQVRCESAGDSYIENIKLEREGLKWKVVEEQLERTLLQEIEIAVPSGARVLVDGIEISDKSEVNTQLGLDIYRTKGAFDGAHLVKCFCVGREDVQVRMTLEPRAENSGYNFIEMPLDEAMYGFLEDVAIEDCAEIFDAIVDEGDITESTIMADICNRINDVSLEQYFLNESYVERCATQLIGLQEKVLWGYMYDKEITGFKLSEAGYTEISCGLSELEGEKAEVATVKLEPFIRESQYDGTEIIVQSVTLMLKYIKCNDEWSLIGIESVEM